MNCGFAIRHPEHAHFFRPPAEELLDRGHDVSLFVREHGPTRALLDHYGLQCEVLAGEPASIPSLVGGHVAYEARLLAAARRRRVDVLAGVGGRSVSHLAPLAGSRSVVFADWNGGLAAGVQRFADVVCTPRFLTADYGPRHVRYDGYHELAYLADGSDGSNRDGALAGVDAADPTFVVEFRKPGVAFDAATALLARRGTVRVTHASAETDAVPGIDRVPAHRTHDALAAADLYVGDSGTAATEAAVLGTPALRLRDGVEREARCADLEDRYGLLETTADPDALLERADELAGDDAARDRWRRRRERLLDDSDDVGGVVTELLLREGQR